MRQVFTVGITGVSSRENLIWYMMISRLGEANTDGRRAFANGRRECATMANRNGGVVES